MIHEFVPPSVNGPGFGARIPTSSYPGNSSLVTASAADRDRRLVLDDGPTSLLPGADAAVGNVDDVTGPVAQQQRGGDGGTLTRRADDGDRADGVDPVGDRDDVVVGRVDRTGDVAGVPLVPLAHVEHLEIAAAFVKHLDVDALELAHRECGPDASCAIPPATWPATLRSPTEIAKWPA